MSYGQIAYFSAAAIVGAFAGLALHLRDGKYTSFAHSAGVVLYAGIFSFGAICVLSAWLADGYENNPVPIGVAALLGLGGQKFYDKVMTMIFGRLNLIEKENKDAEKPN